MEQEKDRDELENLFKKVLGQEEGIHPPEAWNTPSIGVWSGIQEGLVNKPQRRIPLFYWRAAALFSLFLLMGTLFLLNQYHRKIVEIAQQLNESEKIIQNLRIEKAQNSSQEDQIGQVIEKENIENTKHFPPTPGIPTKNNGIKTALTKVDWLPENPDTLFSTGSKPKFPVQEKKQVVVPIANVSDIPVLPRLKFQPQKKHFKPVNTFPKTVAKKARPTHFYAALTYAPMEMDLKGELPFDRPGRNNEVMRNTSVSGLNLGVQFAKNWSLETGLEYLVSKQEVTHQPRIAFSQFNEQENQSGDLESVYSVTLRNETIANTETDLTFVRDPSTFIPEGSLIDLQVTMTMQSTSIGIPLSLKYHYDLGRLNVGAEAGLYGQFLRKTKASIQGVEVQNFALIHRRSNLKPPPPNRTQSSLSIQYLAGLSLEYELNPKFSVLVEPSFSRGINPILQIEQFKLFEETKRLTAGIKYRFL